RRHGSGCGSRTGGAGRSRAAEGRRDGHHHRAHYPAPRDGRRLQRTDWTVSGMKKRVVILISGRGSNMAALIEAAGDPNYPVEIVGVISDKADAKGLNAAAAHKIDAKAITRADYPTKAAMDEALDAELTRMKADVVCLAGYMRLLSPAFT